jgi:hypothetical protein
LSSWYERNKEEQYRRNKESKAKDPEKGNIQIISQIANAMKWDSTPSERIAFAKWVLATEKEDALVGQL